MMLYFLAKINGLNESRINLKQSVNVNRGAGCRPGVLNYFACGPQRAIDILKGICDVIKQNQSEVGNIDFEI